MQDLCHPGHGSPESLKKEGNGPSFICDNVSPSGSSPKGESPQKTFLASYLGLKKPLE